MVPLFSTQQVREIDNYAINEIGYPGIVLMENAAIQITNFIRSEIILKNKIKKIGAVCGKGNNGGDGFAVLRQLYNSGFEVTTIHIGKENEMSPDCQLNFKLLRQIAEGNSKITIREFSDLKDINLLAGSDVILDAMLGSGAKDSLREPYKSIVELLNKIKTKRVAVDIPTGLDSDTGYGETIFNADLTVTLAEFKKGLFIQDGYANCGKVYKGSIGVDPLFFDRFNVSEYLVEPEDAFDYLPKKNKKAHKYSTGKVLTIAGSGNLPGAAAIASKSALRVGAGASILAFPKSVRKLIHKKISEVVVNTYEDNGKEILSVENIKGLNERIKWADVVAIGPGLGREGDTQEAVLKILKERKCKKFVIDADAIFALNNGKYKSINLQGFVVTPHHGEFANLIGIETKELQKDLFKYGKEFVQKTGTFLILKGAPTIIFTPQGDSLINTTGNPGMAKFGTGDVLTGVLAGMISQQNDIEKAVVSGTYIHSLSSDLLTKNYTEFTYTAEDIIKYLPKAFKFLRDTFD